MPNLSLERWERYIPALGDNKEQQRPFFLRIRAGMTKTEYDAFLRRWKDWIDARVDSAETLATVFEGVLALGDEPLSIAGAPMADLAGLLGLLLTQLDGAVLHEIFGAIRWFNTVEGQQELFYERRSGGDGFTSTTAPKTVASRGGRETKL